MADWHSPFTLLRNRDRWLLFRNPQEVLQARKAGDVMPLLRQVEEAVERGGNHGAGFITYEAAPAFDPAFHVRSGGNLPLAWFGIFRDAEEVDLESPLSSMDPRCSWAPSLDWPEYEKALAEIRRWILEGDTYQVNFTFRLRSPFSADPYGLFLRLIGQEVPSCAAFVNTGRFAICSASPELLLERDGGHILSRPMKGTAPRGRTLEEDRGLAAALVRSEKERAENVMIVDMVRNDFGRVARPGSVAVTSLFEAEKYPTLWQMTSTVEASSEASTAEVLQALLPPASVTGAPKVATTRMIAQLETAPRGIYCGAIGHLSPGRRARFSVAIRTAAVDRESGEVEYGVGGGIVWESDASAEFEECRTKSRILGEPAPDFSLLETLLWTPGEGYHLLDRHLLRLQDSAEYFSFPVPLAEVRARLQEAAKTLPPEGQRVRLTVDRRGAVDLSLRSPDANRGKRPRVCMAPFPVRSRDPFLYHKTTNRALYDRALGSSPSHDEVLLWNEGGELTEFCTANLFVLLKGEMWTPPVRCGLLPGTYRAWCLEQGRAKERVLTPRDLAEALKVFLANSVRGMVEVDFDPSPRDGESFHHGGTEAR